MGSVRKVKHPSGKDSWQARWRDPAGNDRARNFARKVDAERYLVGVESDKLTGRYADPRLGRAKLEDWIAEWQSTRTNLTAQTRLRDDASIRNHILPSHGGIPMGRLRPVDIARWVAELDGRGLAPATVRKAYELLAAALDGAVDNSLIPVSPCRRIQLPRLTQPGMRILEPPEIGQLAGVIDRRYRAMVLTAAHTRLRFGELAALRVERFDAQRKSLRVEESLAEVRGAFCFKSPKSESGRRTVSLPSFIVDELTRHLTEDADNSGLVFSAPSGGSIRRNNFRRRIWLPAVRA